ncbi:uncharacterized protein LOC111559474 isoform X4 [Felis catus]|uniref:uncharacterized protein LOC111559474 isoform X4 n=1 Tax=Felis catus TaxID=9685 RepID=UPI001D19FA27|nr:uncharacterized protein LOC111559474 isoform X4 [Felis catus]
MFSCCFPRYRGSGCQKPQCAGLLRCWRGFLNPRWRCLRMFSRRSHKSHMPEMEEKLNESPCSTSLKERRKPHAISTKPRWLRGMNISPMPDNENREEGTTEGGWMLLEQRVEHLVPAFLGGDPSYLFTFLSTYRAFATTQQVLEILFMRYGCFHSEAEEDGGPREQEKLAISSILGTWMDHYPEEFFRPPDFTSLKLLRAYVRVHMPGSELQRRARLLYSWRKHPLAAALEPRPDVPRERAPAISVVPTAASQPRLPEATSSPGAQRVRESETLTAATPPGQEEWTIDGGWMLLEQRVEHLVPAFLGGDPSYLFTFLSTYRAFATSQQVLEILFMRYGCFHSEAEEDGGPREQEKLAISSILGTWMDHYPEEFFRPPDFTSLKLLRAYVRVHMPGSELQRRARLLYSWRKHPLAAALEPRPDVPRERAPAISVVPTAASQPRLPEATSSPGAQRVRESETLTAATPPGQEEWTIDGGWMLLEQRVEHLVPAFLGGDPSYLFTFLSTYRAFATTQQVLEILFMRYGCFHSEAEEDGGPREQEKRAISSILGTWLDHYPEEFFRPPDFTSLKLLRAFVRVHMPGSELQRRARLLYSWRKHPMAPAPEPRSDVPQERAPAISVVPTAASQPRLPEATSSPGAQRVRESETLTAASPTGQEVLPALADSQELEEPPAPLVAPEHEQPPAPAGGVTEGLEQPPAATEQPASAPHQRLMLVCHDRMGIEVFSVLMYYWLLLKR